MNARGIALAADSAVTLGDARRVYFTAEKLFELTPSVPVGIMTYGRADLTGVPWETIVAAYRKHIGDRRHETLADYLSDFVAFIEGAAKRIGDDRQRQDFADVVGRFWSGSYARPWMEELAEKPPHGSDGAHKVLRRLIAEDQALWEQHPKMEQFDASFADAVMSQYDSALKEVEQAVFGPDKLPEDIRNSLRKTLGMYLSRESGCSYSGLVIAGMGESEHFPRLLHCSVGPLVKDRLRLESHEPAQIMRDGHATIVPFAQREIIYTIINGIHPDLADRLPTFVSASVDKAIPKKVEGEILERAQERLEREIQETYSEPFMDAVAGMPRQELATIAEVLVSLTAFRAHASTNRPETVGEPVDVALLSKGEGFVWVKRKRVRATDYQTA